MFLDVLLLMAFAVVVVVMLLLGRAVSVLTGEVAELRQRLDRLQAGGDDPGGEEQQPDNVVPLRRKS